MKRSIILSVYIFFVSPGLFSQNLDLIVTTGGDSIACNIDSITTDHIHISSYWNNEIVKGSLASKDVSKYEFNAIKRRKIARIPGSIYFKTKPTKQVKIRAEKKKEKAELLDQSYESMKIIIHSGTYKFFADRVFLGRTSKDLSIEPNNYIAIRKNEFSSWLSGLPLKRNSGEIMDSNVIENDKTHKILVEVSIPNSIVSRSEYGNLKLYFTIMADGVTELILKDGTGSILKTYIGNIVPSYTFSK